MTAVIVVLAIPASAAGAQAANQAAEARMVAAINEVRAQHGLYALQTSRSLTRSAGRFSHWLMANNSFGHLSSIQASNRFALLGECLAMHTGRRFSARGTVNRWMVSPSHRALVLTPTMRWLGTGVTRGRFGATPATMWVLHLGKLHAPDPALPNTGLPLP